MPNLPVAAAAARADAGATGIDDKSKDKHDSKPQAIDYKDLIHQKINSFTQNDDFKNGFQQWSLEIQDQIDQTNYWNLKKIGQEFGLLGMIIYLRADKLHQNWFNKNKQNTIAAAEQLRLGGNVPRGGIPPAPLEFLVFISERMTAIINSRSGRSSSSSMVDSILPSLHEIHHCIVNNLVTPKESIIYKLILDFYECTSDRVQT